MKLPTVTTVVSRERVREFAMAIGDDSPVYCELAAAQAAGHPDVPLPPTMLFGIGAELDGNAVFDALGLVPAQVLHVEQSFVFHLPVHAGEELTFVSVASTSVRRGSAFVVQETEVFRAGVLVADLREVLMA